MDFVDIHSHVLPGLDDGAPDVSTAVRMLKMAYKDGIRYAIVTPHYISGTMENSRTTVHKAVTNIRNIVKAEGIKMEVFPGNEIYLDVETVRVVESNLVYTLNESRYILVELPLAEVLLYTKSVLFELIIRGYVPIIAHPERNAELIKQPRLLLELIEGGALVQVNSSSLSGLYGRRVYKTAHLFIKKGLVHFVATDAHSLSGRKPLLNNVFSAIASEFGTEYARKIFIENGMAVIIDKAITPWNTVKNGKSRKIFLFY
jgi:protein-tyrosine phosphatase